MKRRHFLAEAGVATGTLLFGVAGQVAAAEETAATAVARSQIWQCKKSARSSRSFGPASGRQSIAASRWSCSMRRLKGALAVSHVPIITKVEGGFTVAVGAKPHPMIKTHWIQWIDLMADDTKYRQFLNPGDKPEAHFCLHATEVSARVHCNLHGLWKST